MIANRPKKKIVSIDPSLQKWYEERSPKVQAMVERFGFNGQIIIDNKPWYIIQFCEDGALGVTFIDPRVDYVGATAQKNRVIIPAVEVDRLMEKKALKQDELWTPPGFKKQ